MRPLRAAAMFCYPRRVARLFTLLAGLAIALSLGMASVVHAAEPAGGFTLGGETSVLSSAGHSQGDTDQVPSDADKGFAHHHGGCHGDHQVAMVRDGAILTHDRICDAALARNATRLGGIVADTSLRPPTA